MNRIARGLFPVFAAAALVVSAGVGAEPGVAAGTILIGHSAGLTGNLAERVNPAVGAANLYFDEVNRKGGVNGRRIRFLSLDDKGETPNTIANTKRLIEQEEVFAILLATGAGPATAAMKLAVEARVPFIAPLTGAVSLRAPNRYVFHVKASFADEWSKLAEHVKSFNLDNVAIVYFDNEAGREGRQLAEAALGANKAPPKAVIGFGGKAGTIKDALGALAKLDPQAIMLASVQQPAAEFLTQMYASGLRPWTYTNSISTGEAIFKATGAKAHGLIISQTVPYPNEITMPLVKEYQALARRANQPAGGYPAIEGFISAKVMVEGLRRAGANPTREGLVDAMQNLNIDLGGYQVRFSPGDHVGSRMVELTMVSREGRFVR